MSRQNRSLGKGNLTRKEYHELIALHREVYPDRKPTVNGDHPRWERYRYLKAKMDAKEIKNGV